MGAPPTSAPPSSSPPPKAEAKQVEAVIGSSSQHSEDDKKVTAPSSSSSTPMTAKEKPETKRAPSLSVHSAGVGETKTPRPTTGGGAKAAAPVDILGDASPILSPRAAAAPPMSELGVAPTAKAPKNPPPSSRPQSGAPVAAAPLDPAIAKPAVAKKSTIEVLNDTTASLSQHSRNIDEHLTKTAGLHAAGQSDSSNSAGVSGAFAAGGSNKLGRAVPFSGSSRPNVPDEEVITVKKQEPKKSDIERSDSRSESKQTAGGSSDAKSTARFTTPQHHFDDALDDVEEIPFLEEGKPEAKLVDKLEAKRTEAHEDDPVIEIESKHAAPKSGASRANSVTAQLQGEAKDGNNNHYDDKAHRSGGGDERDDERDDDRLLSTARRESHDREDIYDELRKLKLSSPAQEDSGQDSPPSSGSHHYHNQPRRDSVDEEAKDSGRDRAREKRKEKRRGRLDEEPKKIQPQVRCDVLLASLERAIAKCGNNTPCWPLPGTSDTCAVLQPEERAVRARPPAGLRQAAARVWTRSHREVLYRAERQRTKQALTDLHAPA